MAHEESDHTAITAILAVPTKSFELRSCDGSALQRQIASFRAAIAARGGIVLYIRRMKAHRPDAHAAEIAYRLPGSDDLLATG